MPNKKKAGHRPQVIDLFSGVGGLSLGAARAGFDVAAAVDSDSTALQVHAKNFPGSNHLARTVRSLSGRALLSEAGLKHGELDGLIGGPPCQGFSVIGHRSTSDTRNHLFSHFFRLVAETAPKFFVAENVPGILCAAYGPARTRALDHVRRRYTLMEPLVVTASDYGAPTKRKRIFFLGFRRDLLDNFDADIFAPPSCETVVVRDALKGLPVKISEEWQSEEQGWRPLGDPELTPFLRKASGRVPEGVGDPMALERYFEKRRVSGCMGTVHEAKVVRRFERLGPGEQDPISKAFRLDPNGLCPTIRAGTGRERGSYQAVRPIHHREARVITPREAARLQGFPDWFVFHGTKWHSFRQIGSSVSPIVAEFLLRKVRHKLN